MCGGHRIFADQKLLEKLLALVQANKANSDIAAQLVVGAIC